MILIKIEPEDVSYTAEICSLSLFLLFKMEIMEGPKDAPGRSALCELSVKEPGDWPLTELVIKNSFLDAGDVVYEFVCKQTVIKLRETPNCYADVPIREV